MTGALDHSARRWAIEALGSGELDLLVIGGGHTRAGAAPPPAPPPPPPPLFPPAPARRGPPPPPPRRWAIEALGSGELDLLVIGGGITGTGAALDAATRGLRVGLVEARDLAAGTSSASSKLIHG